MLDLNRLKEFLAECKSSIVTNDAEPKTMFNYVTAVLDDSELSNVLKDREEGENSFLIGVVPEFYMKGQEDSTEWQNVLAFFILDKTDYSEHDRDSYFNVFSTTQVKAKAFIDKIVNDKSNNSGMFCNLFAKLDEKSISVKPVWKKNGCNGWIVELNFDTPF